MKGFEAVGQYAKVELRQLLLRYEWHKIVLRELADTNYNS